MLFYNSQWMATTTDNITLLIVSKREPCINVDKTMKYDIIHYQIELQSPHFQCFG